MTKNTITPTIFKGRSRKKFHRPAGAGNFDNMDDYNFVKTVNAQFISGTNISGASSSFTGDVSADKLIANERFEISGADTSIYQDGSSETHILGGMNLNLDAGDDVTHITLNASSENTEFHRDTVFKAQVGTTGDRTGSNVSGAYFSNIIFDNEASPPTASLYPIGTVYIKYSS